jgi:broad specificity phosphatase PhoE
MDTKQAKIFLMRHGESKNNVEHLLNSWPEVRKYSLTEKGRAQVRAAGEILAQNNIDLIVSSPIQRTKETAAMLSELTGAPVIEDERLRETDFGDFNECDANEIWKKYPNPLIRLQTDGSDGVESFTRQHERLHAFWTDLRRDHVGKNVVIVSHGDPLGILRGCILGLSLEEAITGWAPQNGTPLELSW